MKISKDNNNFEYLENLEDAIGEYKSIVVWSVLQFYRLIGRRTLIVKDNIEPIPDMKYVIFSGHEKKYYLRKFHGWTLDQTFFNRRTLEFINLNESIESLLRYIYDGNVWLLMSPEQVTDTTEMLKRIWKAQYMSPGKLSYKNWINLLEQSLQLEDHKNHNRNIKGFLTVCKQYEQRIRGIWDEAYKTKT